MTTQKVQSIIQDYSFHNMILHRFVDGISHDASIIQLPFKHNCLNWILGHIVTNRSHVLEVIDAEHGWQDDVRALYHQDTQPITPESPSIRFNTLIAYLDESVNLLIAALENVSAEWLKDNFSNYRGEKTRYEHIRQFHWHESFHLGQVEILKVFIESKR